MPRCLTWNSTLECTGSTLQVPVGRTPEGAVITAGWLDIEGSLFSGRYASTGRWLYAQQYSSLLAHASIRAPAESGRRPVSGRGRQAGHQRSSAGGPTSADWAWWAGVNGAGRRASETPARPAPADHGA